MASKMYILKDGVWPSVASGHGKLWKWVRSDINHLGFILCKSVATGQSAYFKLDWEVIPLEDYDSSTDNEEPRDEKE